GFHVDPGFHGQLKFSVYNAGSTNALIDPMKPLFQIWFSELKKSETKETAYDESHDHQNQATITAGDIEHLQGTVVSPATLLNEITDIKLELRYYRAFAALLAAILIPALLIPL